jgi:hypothetical protein
MGRASKSGKTSGDFGQQFSSHKKQFKKWQQNQSQQILLTSFVTVK